MMSLTLELLADQDSSLSFFSKPIFVKNQITFDFNYGMSLFSNSEAFVQKSKIANAYNAELKYAFTRIYPIERSSAKYYASEFVGIENISSDLKPRSVHNIGIPIDLWRISVGYRNGNVIDLGKLQSILYHSSSLNWNRIDFPEYLMEQQSALHPFDDQFTFGTAFDFGISTKIKAPWFLNVHYQTSLMFPNLELDKYAGSAVGELLIQRGLDYLNYKYGYIDPTLFPLINWLAKGAVSYLLYSARESNSFYPFESSKALRLHSFKIGINLLLKSTSREIN